MKQRTALITGASGGIGREIAKAFAKKGYRTILHYNSNKKRALDLKEELHKNGYHDVLVYGANLNISEEIDKLMIELQRDSVAVDILVNNAGVKDDAPINEMSDNQFSNVIKTNVIGTFMLTKRLVIGMKKREYGRIINISSGLAQHGSTNKINYGASKAAVENMTKNLAVELGPYGITANTVAPGLIETEMTKDVTKEEKEKYIGEVPLRRLAKGKDVAYACLFFADELSGAISNQVIGVNGGLR